MPDLQFYKCWAELQDPKVPEKALLDWWCSNNKQYHCIFCGTHGTLDTTFTVPSLIPSLLKTGITGRLTVSGCPRCKEYKGIEPCIPGYCPFEEE